MTRVIGTKLFLGCARNGCDAVEEIDVGELEPGFVRSTAYTFAEVVEEDWPEGWGWDTLPDGINRVLHCPAHRGAAGIA